MTYPKFLEYLNSKGKTLEKGKIDLVGDNVDVPKPKAKDDPHHTNKTKDKQPQVKEYLDEKGKLVEKPNIEEIGDYKFPDPKAPGKNITKGKGWKSRVAQETGDSPQPYRAAGIEPGQQKKEQGFADLGYKGLIYEPNTEGGKSPYIPSGETLPSWGKTEQFLAKTRDMSLQEFTSYMLEECACQIEEGELPTVTAYAAGKFHPAPQEAIRYIVALAEKNGKILEHLIHEIKRESGLKKLVETIVEHPEFYQEFVALLSEESGVAHCNALARAMNEEVGPPFGMDDEDEPEGEEHHEDDEDEDVEDEMGDMEDEDEEDMGDEEEDEEEEDEEEEDEDEDEDDDIELRRHPKNSAHKNVLAAMSKYDLMRRMMHHQ